MTKTNYPNKTYELRLSFMGGDNVEAAIEVKNQVKDWLCMQGFESFVEGIVDDIYIDPRTDVDASVLYEEMGGDASPISVFKFAREALIDLQLKLEHRYAEGLTAKILEHDTQGWMEGWKQSFRPVETKQFVVYPPWEKISDAARAKIQIVIEPGMAFGTGQHATTMLCLELIEELVFTRKILEDQPEGERALCDVGTGTGILAIGARKLGFNPVMATDIDEDAVSAATINARENTADIDVKHTAIPAQQTGRFTVVVANILAPVLHDLMEDLAGLCRAEDSFIILSGILVTQKDALIRAAADYSFSFLSERTRDDWSAILLGR